MHDSPTTKTKPPSGKTRTYPAHIRWGARILYFGILASFAYGVLHTAGQLPSISKWIPAITIFKSTKTDRQIEIMETAEALDAAQHGSKGSSWLDSFRSKDSLSKSLTDSLGTADANNTIQKIKDLHSQKSPLVADQESSDTEIAARADSELAGLESEIRELETQAQREFKDEGVELTLEQIRSLHVSPHADDAASIMIAFGTLKSITEAMETQARKNPSSHSAERYYGSYLALLNSLNTIQQNALDNIEYKHKPAIQTLMEKAVDTATEASQILASSESLSDSETRTLKNNITICRKTEQTAEITLRKLEANAKIIQIANKRLEKSIATADNSRITAVLHSEIKSIDAAASKEIAAIEALVVPKLADIRFADPEPQLP